MITSRGLFTFTFSLDLVVCPCLLQVVPFPSYALYTKLPVGMWVGVFFFLQISHLLSKPNELSLIYQVGGARAVDDRSLESNPGQLVDSEDEVEQFRTPEHSVTSVMVSHSVADPLFGSGSGEHSLLADVRRAGEQFGVRNN